jgi:hypothetical protein
VVFETTAACALFDLDEKNASGSDLKNGSQSGRTTRGRRPVKILILTDYQRADRIFSIVRNAPVTEVVQNGIGRAVGRDFKDHSKTGRSALAGYSVQIVISSPIDGW